VTLEAELAEVDEILADGLAFLAEEDSEIVGFVLARRRRGRAVCFPTSTSVRSCDDIDTEQTSLGQPPKLLHQRGATHVTLSVHVANAPAKAAYERWGFQERTLTLAVTTAVLKQRLSETS
jgi:ribosomal protein S18 acetylase RimI-like enzyme